MTAKYSDRVLRLLRLMSAVTPGEGGSQDQEEDRAWVTALDASSP